MVPSSSVHTDRKDNKTVNKNPFGCVSQPANPCSKEPAGGSADRVKPTSPKQHFQRTLAVLVVGWAVKHKNHEVGDPNLGEKKTN